MSKKILPLCILSILWFNSFAQKENNIWYFGPGTGLDFNTGTPKVLTGGSVDGFEGCAAISDKKTGTLLFYTNSDKVWNKNHQLMANGDLQPNSNSISQVVIIQKPGCDSLYYIFTAETQASAALNDFFSYHEININKDGGLGEVVLKNQHLYGQHVTEKILPVRHTNGRDIWIIGHECGSDKFFSFLVTSAGISKNPVISSAGKVHEYNTYRSNWDAIGLTAASPDGSKIAVATFSTQNIEVLNFNRSTGRLSDGITLHESGAANTSPLLGGSSRLYGVCFSPDNSLLYASVGEFPCKLIQFNLQAGSENDINLSKQVIFSNQNEKLYGLHPAPDGKIYTGSEFRNFLGVINNPNAQGQNCGYVHDGLYLDGKKSGWVLANGMAQDTTPVLHPPPTIGDKFTWQLYPNPSIGPVTLAFTNSSKKAYTFELYDAIGRQIEKRKNITTSEVQFNTQFLAAGIYFVVLHHDKEIAIATKLKVSLE